MLICENCGHENRLDVDTTPSTADQSSRPNEQAAEQSPASTPAKAVETTASRQAAEGFGDNDQVRMWLRDDALKALVPEAGAGLRCRKCARLVDASAEHCSRCGLSLREAEAHGPGEAPWEQAPVSKESEFEQAKLLWESFADNPSEQAFEKFVEFVRTEELLDLGIRRLRFHLVDHPDDESAVAHLRDLAESLQSRLIVAQVQAQASADEFQDDVSRFKNRLVLTALVFWVGVFLLFVVFIGDNCGIGSMPSL
jgi:hypothetical protein